jgi:hypothetical protein
MPKKKLMIKSFASFSQAAEDDFQMLQLLRMMTKMKMRVKAELMMTSFASFSHAAGDGFQMMQQLRMMTKMKMMT